MSTATAVRTYAIDKTHSEAAFQVRHLITKVRGRFDDFGGTIDFNAEQPAASKVRFEIQAASIDTSTPDRDAHLRERAVRDLRRQVWPPRRRDVRRGRGVPLGRVHRQQVRLGWSDGRGRRREPGGRRRRRDEPGRRGQPRGRRERSRTAP